MSTASDKYAVRSAPQKQCCTYDERAEQEDPKFPFDPDMTIEAYAAVLRTTGKYAKVHRNGKDVEIPQYYEWLNRPSALGPTDAELELEQFKRARTMV